MRIVVHLHSILQRKTPEGMQRKLEVDLPEGSTIHDLVEHLEVEVAPEHLSLALNGRVARLEKVMNDGDKVHLMVPISGG
jgi:sulfur carrier protein ThiS